MLCAAAGTPPPCPDDMLGSLASVVLPDGQPTGIGWRRPDPIQGRLFERWRIEVPVMSWPEPPRRLIRISAQIYNDTSQYARLADALRQELAAEGSRSPEA